MLMAMDIPSVSVLAWLDIFSQYLPSLIAVLIIVASGWVFARIIERSMSESRLRRATKYGVYGVLSVIGIVLFVVMLPVSNAMKKNILKVGGLVVTLAVAFSSTTLIRDAAAGIAMQFFNTFKRGDYLQTDDHFGRVTQMGLVHTEIQTSEGRLLTMANSTLFRQSFETISANGAIVDTTVTIGYDVPWQKVEYFLIEAADRVGLNDPFVQVTTLGNHAVKYRVAGVLAEPEKLLTYDSNLNKAVLDVLHKNDIEIASPRLENQRRHDETTFVPTVPGEADKELYEDDARMEDLTFEKAIEAEQAADLQDRIQTLEDKRTELQQLDEDVELRIRKLDTTIERLERRKQNIEDELEKRDEGSS